MDLVGAAFTLIACQHMDMNVLAVQAAMYTGPRDRGLMIGLPKSSFAFPAPPVQAHGLLAPDLPASTQSDNAADHGHTEAQSEQSAPFGQLPFSEPQGTSPALASLPEGGAASLSGPSDDEVSNKQPVDSPSPLPSPLSVKKQRPPPPPPSSSARGANVSAATGPNKLSDHHHSNHAAAPSGLTSKARGAAEAEAAAWKFERSMLLKRLAEAEGQSCQVCAGHWIGKFK